MESANKESTDAYDEEDGMARYCLHINFLASSDMGAKWAASEFMESLKIVRPEVCSLGARVSPDNDWSKFGPVFCLAHGPLADDRCLEAAGHTGCHFGEAKSRQWTDADVSARNSIQTLF